MSTRTLRARVVALAFAACATIAARGSAVIFNVNSFDDGIDDDLVSIACHAKDTPPGTCTLRAAVMQANVMPSDSTIVLPAGTYVLDRLPVNPDGADNGDLNLATPTSGSPTISIYGAGAATTIIDGGDLDRVIFVEVNRVATIAGVTVRNGTVSGASGGGILNGGFLILDSVTVSGNMALEGNGGGIDSYGTLTMSRSTLTGNAAYAGGGLGVVAGTNNSVDQSTIFDNQANHGGGVENISATLYISNSTISQNRSDRDGGGIRNRGTTWTYNATIAFNSADDNDDGEGNGGGVFNESGSNFFPRNSVLAGNRVQHFFFVDCLGTAGVFGHTWFGDLTGCVPSKGAVTAEWDEIVSLAELGPLRFNGGSTMTHALLAGSTMVDSGFACNGTGDPSIDQRGGARTPVGTCDAGAFEYGALSAGLIFEDGFELGNLWAWG